MSENTPVRIERLSTGSRALDGLIGGGVPEYSLNVIAGGPGTGKSVLTLAVLFHQARLGKKAIYFTTLSEPAVKFFRYMQQYSFFDQGLVDKQIFFFDLNSAARSGGLDGVLEAVIEQIDLHSPDVIAIDSFRAFRDLTPDVSQTRALAYDLSVAAAAARVTTFLVGEYYPEEIGRAPEFTVADGIFHLMLETENYRATRLLEILKLRGSSYVSGRHFFDITQSGLTVYPRVSVPTETDGGAVDHETFERVKVGVAGLDELLGGGIPARSSTVIQGGSGTGKTLLSLAFLLEGARHGEPGVFLTLEETREQIFRIAVGRGWDLNALDRSGLLRVIYTSPVELAGDALFQMARQEAERIGARRVVIDSLSALGMSIASEGRFRELVYAMVKVFRALGITAVLTNEVPEVMGQATLSGHGVSSIADNIILLRHFEVDGELRRALAVLKMRGTAHAHDLQEFEITGDQIRVVGPLRQFQGVLVGLPTPNPAQEGRRRHGAPTAKRKT